MGKMGSKMATETVPKKKVKKKKKLKAIAAPMHRLQPNLFMKEKDEVKKVVTALASWGCCPRCILRYLGEKKKKVYKRPLVDLRKLLKSLSEDKKPEWPELSEDWEPQLETSEGVCTTCLGILQGYCCDVFTEEVQKKVEELGYEFHSFSISLFLPVATLIRWHSIWVLLRETLPSIYLEKSPDSVTQVKDVWKWINGPLLAKRLNVPLESKSTFDIGIHFQHKEAEKECEFLYDLDHDMFKRRKNNKTGTDTFNKTNVAHTLETTSDRSFRSFYTCPPKTLRAKCVCEKIVCQNASIYLAGRYNKYSRVLSQTPWFVDGDRKSESSVQELLCTKILEIVKPQNHNFSSAGREDVDVLMLGIGRPFVVELVNPRIVTLTPEQLAQLQKDINASSDLIGVRDLQKVSKEDTAILKAGETEKTKQYLAHCRIEKPITQEELDTTLSGIKDLMLYQKTPVRVLHRRPLAVRERMVHSMSAKLKDECNFSLTLHTQAGTYIKEFVHGDFGRTKPSLGDILKADCDILQLDVESVDVDWPKRLDIQAENPAEMASSVKSEAAATATSVAADAVSMETAMVTDATETSTATASMETSAATASLLPTPSASTNAPAQLTEQTIVAKASMDVSQTSSVPSSELG